MNDDKELLKGIIKSKKSKEDIISELHEMVNCGCLVLIRDISEDVEMMLTCVQKYTTNEKTIAIIKQHNAGFKPRYFMFYDHILIVKHELTENEVLDIMIPIAAQFEFAIENSKDNSTVEASKV